ncbi:MAG: hypothetical protein SV186_03675 [Candidatus Nanohaloarchaea archaeon]|nr:hypothetical protein [Candidatus Nanohaloarchaea archaeon]
MAGDPGDSATEEFSFGDAAILAILTFIGIIGVYLSSLTTDSLINLRFDAILDPSLAYLALLVFPVAWVANMSFERFRTESLAAFIVLPGVFRGGVFAVFCLGFPLAVVFASYMARSVFNGKNYFWTCFKTGSAIVMVLGVVFASVGAYSMAQDADMRETVRGAVADKVTDRALEAVNATVNSGSGQTLMAEQRQLVVELSSRVASNVSTATLQAARIAVFRATKQADGTAAEFKPTQINLLNRTFEQLQTSLPSRLSDRISGRVGERMDERIEQVQPSKKNIRQDVRARIDSGLSVVFDDTRLLAALTFIVLLSLIYTFKIPFELLTGMVGYLIHRMVA